MVEEKLNSELLEERIRSESEVIEKLPIGSEERSREIENFRKLYSLSLEEENSRYERFMKEQELELKLKHLEFEKYKLKHIDVNELLKCVTVSGTVMGGAIFERSEGILIDSGFKKLSDKIKL